jgi:hypothetical protein
VQQSDALGAGRKASSASPIHHSLFTILPRENGPLKKLRGCIAASPIVPFGFVEELTSSSWLSFSLPFYSPPDFLNLTPALLAERVFNLMYSDTDLSCQEESEVRDKKNEISIPETGKLECAETSARIILHLRSVRNNHREGNDGIADSPQPHVQQKTRGAGYVDGVISGPGMPIMGKNAELGRCI